MFSHVNVGVRDFEAGYSFYEAVFECLGLELQFKDGADFCAGWTKTGEARPMILVSKPINEEPHHPGNGQMNAFQASDRATVRRAWAEAIELGGVSEGDPGPRPHYHPDYYGAYFRDLDGNKICVCCHEPEQD
jgi:catechol 2,3-dioxygenase-like lactoylglutathione lyase family enzyme